MAAAVEPAATGAVDTGGEYRTRPEHDARRVFSMSRREKLRTCGLQPHYGWLQNGADEYEFLRCAFAQFTQFYLSYLFIFS